MYFSHFGLKQPPFKITPNTEFFFSGGNRGAVLDALVYAIKNGEGIVKVVGEVGSGKTMLCRMLQTMLPSNIEQIYLANPSVAPEDILHAIAFELQLKLPNNADKLKVMQALQSHLLTRHVAGKQVVIFVEEAQGMPLATLEEIRLLSNLETKHDKLLQIVLFGQPELDVNLNQTNIRQLRERITHSFYLSPFKPKEIGDYLIFRLRAAGYYGPHLFTDKAIQKISNAAEGLVRRVNILADKSMLAAFADNVYQITPKHVNAAIADSEFGAEAAKKKTKKHVVLGLIGAIVLGLLVGFGLKYWQQNDLHSRFFPEQLPEIAPQNDLTLPPVLEPTAQPDAKLNENNALVVEAPATLTENMPVAAATSAVAPITTPAAETTPQLAPDAVVLPAPATSTPVVPIVNAPVAAPPSITGEANIAQTSTAQTSTTQIGAIDATDDLLQARIDLTKDWLNTQSRDTVTIQLMGVADEWELKKYLNYLSQQIELDNIYVYRTKVNNQPFLTVLYGTFADRQLANEALQKLPAKLRQNRPHLRTVGGILDETNKNQ